MLIHGLGNDGNEFKIITQVFLYKFMNDKFAFEVKKIEPNLKQADNWEEVVKSYSEDDYEMLLLQLGADTAKTQATAFYFGTFQPTNESDFAKLFDDTLLDIAITNNDIFSAKTDGGAKVGWTNYRIYQWRQQADVFAKSHHQQTGGRSFEHIFQLISMPPFLNTPDKRLQTPTAEANMQSILRPTQ